MTGDDMNDTIGPDSGTDELDELLGAYALDALDADETRRVEDYLSINPRAATEVQAHREVATMLAFTGMDAPAGLWDRIADEIGETDEIAPPPGPELARVLSMNDRPRRISAAVPWIMSAAAVIIVALVAVGLADRADAPNEPLTAAIDHARSDRDSLSTTLTSEASAASAEAIIDQDGHGYVLARDLPTLADDQTYQLWGVVSNGDVISLGIFGPNPELETFTVEGPVTALAITIEQHPGVISDGNPDGAFVGTF